MTIYAVYANGIFWGTFEGESKDEALLAAVEEYGTADVGTEGMEARTLNEVIRMIREYDDQPIEELVAEWSNQSEVEVDEDGDIWVANPGTGHWLGEEAKAKFVEWCEFR